MVSLTRHSRESGNPVLQGSNRWPWTPAFAGATNKAPPRAPSASPAQGVRRARHHAQRRRPSDDLQRPLLPARGKHCAPADLRPRRSRLCAARRGRRLYSPSATAPLASPGRPAGPVARGSRSTPMAAASPTCIPACPACTPCRKSVCQMRGTAPPIPRRQDFGLPRRRRNFGCRRHHHSSNDGKEGRPFPRTAPVNFSGQCEGAHTFERSRELKIRAIGL